MKNDHTILCCKRCGSFLAREPKKYICNQCFESYPIRDGIILMGEKTEETDLRIGEDLLDIHELRNQRKYNGAYIKSDVDYAARLHSVNFPNFHAELLSSYFSDSIILDLGCGQLPYVESFPETEVKEFYGVDLSLESLKIARRNFKRTFPLNLVRHGVRNIPFREASVDIVVSSEVLEHLDHPKDYLEEIYKVMKNGGYLSLSTPCASTYFYPHNLLKIVVNPIRWYKVVNCHSYWQEVLHWHPGLRPRILRKMWRLFSLIEEIGIFSAGNILKKYLKGMDVLLASNIPIIKWLGIRQFILCQKKF